MFDPVTRRLRAPSEDGASLIDPPLAKVADLIAQNQRVAVQFDQHSGYRPKSRILARTTILPRASEARLDSQFFEDAKQPLILSGHQPELFHSGVWFKNFLISAIAQRVNGCAINLVIDNDLARSTSVRVPAQRGRSAQVIDVPFDAPSDPIPWENRRIENENVFRSFADEVRQTLEIVTKGCSKFRQGIILDRFWPYAIEALESQQQQSRELDKKLELTREYPPQKLTRLGDALASARRRTEVDLGISIHDHYLRRFGFDPFFLEFAGLLISRHREFHTIHNAALAEFRKLNHIRSHSHPVPELANDGEWFEMPFWVWTVRGRQRRRVFVRKAAEGVELTDRQDIRLRLSSDLSQQSAALIDAQVRLRPRALITTMYARLVLSDLFVHGIGGAKYDELTDLIIRRFFGIEPPAYVTATATFRLPIDRPQVTLDDVRSGAGRIRDVRYRPESFLSDPLISQDAALAKQLQAFAAEKRDYLAQHDLRHCSPVVFENLDRLNRAMHDLLVPIEEQLRADHAALVEQWKQSQALGSREFSFVLFPSKILPARLLDLCKVSS